MLVAITFVWIGVSIAGRGCSGDSATGNELEAFVLAWRLQCAGTRTDASCRRVAASAMPPQSRQTAASEPASEPYTRL